MFKFPVIFVATIISMVMANPNLYNQGQWNQFKIQPDFNSHDNQLPIDWNQYSDEGNNGLNSYPNRPQNYWNKYPNNNNNNNGFDSQQNEPPNQWNNYPNGANDDFNPNANQNPNQWNNYPNEGNNNQIESGHGSGNNKITDCAPTKIWKDVAGMQSWCRANCFHIPSYCPSSHCRCW